MKKIKHSKNKNWNRTYLHFYLFLKPYEVSESWTKKLLDNQPEKCDI